MKVKKYTMYKFTLLSLVLISSLVSLNASANDREKWGPGGYYKNSNNNWVGSFNSGASNDVRAKASYSSWGMCSQYVRIRATGGCNNFDNSTSSTGCTGRDMTRTVTLNPGGTTRCVIDLWASRDGASNQWQEIWKVNQVVALVNPGSKDDVAPNYTVNASARTADGLSNTLSSTNTFTFESLTPTICTIASVDINSAVINNDDDSGGGTCTVRVTASGDDHIQGPVSNTQSWPVVNTRIPQLTLITPPGQGRAPSFVYESSLPSIVGGVSVTGSGCSGATATAIAGTNTYRFNALTLGNTYTCTLSVTNENGTSTLALPPFTVTESTEGPGGVGGADGQTGTVLWLKGGNWLTSGGNITTWLDHSGKDFHFSGGTAPTITTLNGMPVAGFNGNYLTRVGANINARSMFIVYRDTSTNAWVTPIMGNGIVHGGQTDAGIHDATVGPYTPPVILSGQNFANGSNIGNGGAHPRPDNWEIHSKIFTGNISGSSDWYLGRDRTYADRAINGGIAEVIITDNVINKAQRIIIENYLAIQYGLQGNLGGDHGAARFTYTGYKYEMAGIGQADDGTSHIKAKGSIMEVSQPQGLANDRFIMWGHNNGTLTFQNTDVPSALGVIHRLNRFWRVRNTGVTAANVTVHLGELPGFMDMCFDPDTVRLLTRPGHSSPHTFDAVDSEVHVGVYNAATRTITFSNIPLSNASFMTIAVGGNPSTVFVKPKASGDKKGNNWANACTLDGALNAPRIPGDVVKVAEGIYKPLATYNLSAPISIIGGFAGEDEAELSDPDEYESIISGDTDNNDEVTGNVTMFHREVKGENLPRLFNIYNLDPVNLEGLTITGMSQFGNHASVVWQQNSVVNYHKVRIIGNRARELGGALMVYGASSVANITDSLFQGNAGEHGGAINLHVNATANITNTDFIGNQVLLLANRSHVPNVLAEGKALQFNGSGDKVTAPSPAAMPTNTFTYEAWVKTDNATHEIDPENNTGTGGTGGQRYLFGAYQREGCAATDASGAGLSVGTNGISVYEHAGCYMPALAVYNSTIGTGWNHIAVVYNNRIPTIYLNGTAVHTGVVSARSTVYAPHEIGAGTYGNFGGQVDEVRIWNTARTQSQIRDNMYREILNPESETSLVRYYKFNDNVEDSSSNAQTAALSGATYVDGTLPSDPNPPTKWNRFEGGAIDVNNGSKLTVTNSRFTDNNALNLDNNATMYGRGGAISMSQNGNNFPDKNRTEVTISGSTFTGNSARDGGGAIYAMPGFKNLTVSSSKFIANTATRPNTGGYWGSGGAIHAQGSPTSGEGLVNITDTEFEGNIAQELGGAVFFAGQYLHTGSQDTYLNVAIRRSSFISNKANFGAGFFAWQFAGTSKHPLLVENSTFTGNVSNNYGGALAAVNGAQLTVKHATIYNNSAVNGGGIFLREAASTLTLQNSILVDNSATGNGPNFRRETTGAAVSASYNLFGYNGQNGVSNWSVSGTGNVEPAAGTNLGQILDATLTNEGGATRYFPLSSNNGNGSLAFNIIPIANCSSSDQRNQSRSIVDLFVRCDIGSFETAKIDTDGDGIIDAMDNCPLHSNQDQSDVDGDNAGDLCDADIDGDGVLNEADFFPTISLHEGMPPGEFRIDTDGDGIPDECDAACISAGMYADTDIDGDGVLNDVDNCPYTDNPEQSDVDGDGLGDACDTDIDGDGIENLDDNCPAVFNPLQIDSNNNGLGDECEALFVAPEARGFGDCSSWNNACAGGSGTQLQAAINKASQQNASQIFMAKGIYRPSATVNLVGNILIYGGFNGISEQYYYEASPENNITVITADMDSNDVVDVDGVTQSYNNQVGSNLTRIFSAVNQGAGLPAGLSGVVITGARSESAFYIENSRVRLEKTRFLGNRSTNTNANMGGGALRFTNNSKIIMSEVDFVGNSAVKDGGAIRGMGTGTELTMTKVTFDSNRATENGGAVYLDGVKVNARNNAFFSNESTSGLAGAMLLNNIGDFYIIGSTFSGNRTITTTASATTGGGALHIQGSGTSIYIGTSGFIENTSSQNGGALTIASDQSKTVTIEDTLFKGNATAASKTGGAISLAGAGTTVLNVTRSSFVSNSSNNGGGIYVSGTNNTLNLTNTTLVDNSVTGVGGGLNLNSSAKANIDHATMVQNSADGNGGAIRANSGTVLTMRNSLVLDNTGSTGANISYAGTYTDNGYNIIGFNGVSGLNNNTAPSGSSFIAVATSIDQILRPVLLDYSGVNLSLALTKDSEARDKIPNGTSGCVTGSGQDERGFDRPDLIDVTDPDQNGDVRDCDIGAFEFNNAYRLDCFEEDGLRPDGGSGFGFYYCPDGTTPTAPELVKNLFTGYIGYWMLLLMAGLGAIRYRRSALH